MEAVHGRRERYYNDKEEQDVSNDHPDPLTPSTSPSSSSSSSCWVSPAEAGEHPVAAPLVEKEHMFDKVVTPSDVGKLNRLVIPKQHAERYFPLDHSGGDKGGLLLCFEECGTGKPWRFRYSYWNSSQSYVMTKGWSRFVKEKQLDAGDTVSFARGISDSTRGRLFIDWRRRPLPDSQRSLLLPPAHPMMPFRSVVAPWSGSGMSFVPPQAGMYGGLSGTGGSGGGYLHLRSPPQIQLQLGVSDLHTGLPVFLNPVPAPKAETKRVRLFGVNLEYSEVDKDRHSHASGSSMQAPLQQPEPVDLNLHIFKGNQQE